MDPLAPIPAWKSSLPNALTLARVFLAAALFAVLAGVLEPPTTADGLTGQASVLLVAVGLFVLAAATDALDGALARKWKVVSLFGRVMDPFADKLLILGSFVIMAGPPFVSVDGSSLSGFTPWMAVVILARELLVTTLRGVYERAGIDFSASWSGKMKMILQSIAIPIILLILAFSPAGEGTTAHWAIAALALAVVVVTVWSGLPYITRAMKAGSQTSGDDE